eukprot:gene5268-8886_t
MQTLTPFSDISSPPSLIEYGEHGTITVIGKDGQESRYPLNFCDETPEVIFGRHSACNIMIKIPSVSRKHAKIELINKILFITPITQNSPTLLNEDPIYEPRQLLDGDIISIGGRHFRFDATDNEKTQFTGSSSGFTKEFQDIMKKDSSGELCTIELSKKLFHTINLKEIQNQSQQDKNNSKETQEISSIPKDFRRHSSVVDSMRKKEEESTKENNQQSPKTPPKTSQPKTPTSILRKSGKRKSVSFAAKMERPHLFDKHQKPSVIVRDKSPKTPEIVEGAVQPPKPDEIALEEANAKWEKFADEIQKQQEEEQDEKDISSISNLSPIQKQNFSYNFQFDEPSIELSNTIKFIHRVESTGINLAPNEVDSEEEKIHQHAVVKSHTGEQVKEFKELPQQTKEIGDVSFENIFDCNPFTPSLRRQKSAKTPKQQTPPSKESFTPTSESKPKSGIEANPSHPVAKELLVDFNASQKIESNVEDEEIEFIGSPDLGAVEEDVDAMEIEETQPEPKKTTPTKQRKGSSRNDSPVVVIEQVEDVEVKPLLVQTQSNQMLETIQEQSPERSPAVDYENENLVTSPTDAIPDFTSLLTKSSPNPFQKSPYKSVERKNEFDFSEDDISSQTKKKLNFNEEIVEEQVEEPKTAPKATVKKTRGRPKKVVAPIEPEVEKTLTTERKEPVKEEVVEKKTRGRKKKVVEEEEIKKVEEVVEKTKGKKKVVEESQRPEDEKETPKEVLKEVQPKTVTNSSKKTIVKTRKGKKKEVKSSETFNEVENVVEPEPVKEQKIPTISTTTIVKTRRNRKK